MKSLIPPLRKTLMLASLTAVNPSAAIEPINFEVRNNGDYVALCSASPQSPDYVAAIHFCHGFAVGFNRYHEALQEGKEMPPLYCLPEKATRTGLIGEYLRYSKSHPEYDRDKVANVIMKFLVETYPCAQGQFPAPR